MISVNADTVIFDRDGMRARLIRQLYTNGVNYVPLIFLGSDEKYGDVLCDSQIAVSKDRFEEVHFNIRRGIKEDISFKKKLIANTWKCLREFKDAVIAMQNDVSEATLDADKMADYLYQHEKVLALTEFNGCLPLNWYEETISEISDGKYRYSDFGCTSMMSHRHIYRNAKLELVETYLKNDKLSAKDMNDFFVKFYHLNPKIDHHMYIKRDEEEKLLTEIKKKSSEYTVESVRMEIESSKEAHKKHYNYYKNNLTDLRRIMKAKNYTKEETENIILAMKIISLATTEEEYRHMIQDKFFRIMAYIFKVYDLCPTYSSEEMLLDTLKMVPFKYVKNNYPVERIVESGG